MHNLQEATERICELKGSLVALDALIPALLKMLPPAAGATLMHAYDEHAEAARTVMLNASISDLVLSTFERDVERTRVLLAALETPSAVSARGSADAVLLTTTRVQPLQDSRLLPAASGFFFQRDGRLYLVTSASVLRGGSSGARPDRVAIELHHDETDLTRRTVLSIPLHEGGRVLWRQAQSGDDVEPGMGIGESEGEAGRDDHADTGVAVVELDPGRVPETALLRAFDPSHLLADSGTIGVGDTLDVIGFTHGGYDTVNHLAVGRRVWVASAYGVHYRRRGCFLTDTPARQGGNGSPVLRRRRGPGAGDDTLPWQLVGVHSAHFDIRVPPQRPADRAEAHGLSCAWYADVLMGLTQQEA